MIREYECVRWLGLGVVKLSYKKVLDDDDDDDDSDNDDDYKNLNDNENQSTDQDYVKNDNIGHEGLRPKLNVLMQRYKIQCSCDLL